MPTKKPLLKPVEIDAIKTPGYHAIGGGLYLHIRKGSTSRAYVARVPIDGKRVWRVVGDVDRMALSTARAAVGKVEKELIEDATKSDATKTNHVPTFKAAALNFIGRKESTWRNEKHRTQWVNTLTTYAFPVIGRTPCNEITVADVVKVLDALGNKLETRKRMRSRIENVIDAAMALHCPGVPYANPANVRVISVVAPAAKRFSKNHEAVPVADAPAVFAQIWDKARGNTSYAALAFAILTAGRTTEVLNADWSEITTALWTLPAGRMKANREHVVPLSIEAMKVLQWRALLSGSALGEQPKAGLVFPGGHSPKANSVKPLSNMAMLTAMRRLMPGTTVHGWRSTFRDWCGETGVNRDLAEAALAHQVSNKTEAAYLRTRLVEQRRAVMQDWTKYLMSKTKM